MSSLWRHGPYCEIVCHKAFQRPDLLLQVQQCRPSASSLSVKHSSCYRQILTQKCEPGQHLRHSASKSYGWMKGTIVGHFCGRPSIPSAVRSWLQCVPNWQPCHACSAISRNEKCLTPSTWQQGGLPQQTQSGVESTGQVETTNSASCICLDFAER